MKVADTFSQEGPGLDSGQLRVQQSAVVEVHCSLHSSTGQRGAGLWNLTFEPLTVACIYNLESLQRYWNIFRQIGYNPTLKGLWQYY